MSPTSGASRATVGDSATRERVISAAVTTILELGFYRASTNEIARRAGVTWGVIQHYFGTREALMLAVLQDGARHFAETVQHAHVTGQTVRERMDGLVDVLFSHYARADYMAHLQILLNMDHDPRTSAEVRTTMREVAEKSNVHIRRLLRETLGPASKIPDLNATIVLVLRGFALSQQLLDTMAYDTLAPKRDRISRQRQLLVEMLTPYLESAAPAAG